jgi:hypothetical protein
MFGSKHTIKEEGRNFNYYYICLVFEEREIILKLIYFFILPILHKTHNFKIIHRKNTKFLQTHTKQNKRKNQRKERN